MSEEEINPAELIDLRRKRRSKNESSGRIYTCEECQKGYLSQPALNNHRKTKHPDKIDPSEEKRGRGRPRKVPSNPRRADRCRQRRRESLQRNLHHQWKQVLHPPQQCVRVPHFFNDIKPRNNPKQT